VPRSALLALGVLAAGAACRAELATVVRKSQGNAVEVTAAHADGTIIELRPLLMTDRSEYLALTYWSGGLRVKGYLGRPRATSERLPAIVWNRGGNRDFGALDARALVPYVEAGFVAAGSQYRGGGGSEGRDSLGGDDVEDVLNLVTLLKGLPEVDPGRIGMVGYSRGGMMTYRALREDARRGKHDIRVAATVGGVADYVNHDLERPDMVPVFLATVGCEPRSCPAEFVERSAVHWAGEIRAPLLLLHGEADDRVPVQHSMRLAAKLEEAGRPVKLVIFRGDDHGLTAHEQGLSEILLWLGEHLGVPRERYARERVLPLARDVFSRWPAETAAPDEAGQTPAK